MRGRLESLQAQQAAQKGGFTLFIREPPRIRRRGRPLVNDDGLSLREGEQSLLAVPAPQAAALHAAERQRAERVVACRLVDSRESDLERGGQALAFVEIGGPDAGGKTLEAGVGECYRVLGASDLHDRNQRACAW